LRCCLAYIDTDVEAYPKLSILYLRCLTADMLEYGVHYRNFQFSI